MNSNNDLSKTILITPVGHILLHTCETHLCAVELLINSNEAETEDVQSSVAQQAVKQFQSYFIDPQSEWTLPLLVRGTVFQKKVWQHLQSIPSGETQTYSEIAQILDTSARAIGNACRKNPFAIVIPCHRVVSKLGFGGYFGKKEGYEIDLKQWLLDHERGL
ncbi:hypothetical protein LCGC14_0571830 [marine sediment metagenome]|uniref:methylated-DNA--[protein]-cysteine S-methyltransferase n=1 Tax=marine sediment metagenome TaxID=412755 RepID=A0A0F9U5B2_9ZZZZ|nr:methylated-DNA--[protein]-cysteine S-methyltransferase [Methylophaga sp.]